MTYVYRDPSRDRRRPVHVAVPLPEARQTQPLPERPPLGPPVWGGPFGLQLAAAEAHDFDKRSDERRIARARLIAATEEIREHNRIHGWKPKPRRNTP